MKTLYILIATCAVCLGTLSGCKQKEGKSTRPITPPKYEGKVDYSVAPTHIDLESALDGEKQPLKLSQIASEIDYYIVGDGMEGIPRRSRYGRFVSILRSASHLITGK